MRWDPRSGSTNRENMSLLIILRTDKFDVNAETPISEENPYRGESILQWLAARGPNELAVENISSGGAGWESSIDFRGASSVVSTSVSGADEGDTGLDREWQIQISKVVPVLKALMGGSKVKADDTLVTYLLALFAREPAFRDVRIG